MRYDFMFVSAKVEKLEEALVSLDVEVTKANVEKNFNKAYAAIGSKVRIPGFRVGNAPKNILKKRYEFSLKKEALEGILEESIKEISKKEGIRFVSNLELENLSSVFDAIKEEESLSFKATAEIYPEINIGDYKSIKVIVPKYIFTEDHVIDKLKEMQYKMASFRKKEPLEEIDGNDLIKVKLRFFDSIEEDIHNEHYINMRELSASFEDIKDELIGMRMGEEKDFSIDRVKGIDEKIASKYKKIGIQIEEIQAQVIPSIDDELARDYNFESVEKLKEDIKNKLGKNCADKLNKSVSELTLNKIIDNSSFSIGKQAIASQIYNYMQKLENDLKQHNLSVEDYANSIKQSTAQIREGYTKRAIKDIQLELIKEEIIKKEKLELNEEDVDTYYKEYAKELNISYEEMLNKVKNNQNIVDGILLHKKFLSFILDNNSFEEGDEELIYNLEQNS